MTDPQIFYPVSESRRFTRVDAGRVFSGALAPVRHPTSSGRIGDGGKEQEALHDPVHAANRIVRNPSSIERVGKGENATRVLQPADVRIPHPQLIMYERDRVDYAQEASIRTRNHRHRLDVQDTALREFKDRARRRREARTTHVLPSESSRFEFRFTDVTVGKETTGVNGRDPRGVGRRYGVPHYDRKKGQVKIPTRVDA